MADDRPVSDPSGRGQWLVGLLRATTFIPDLSVDDSIENTWWDKTVDDKPDDEHIDRKNGVKEQKGSLNGNRLVMVSRPGRVDWTLGTAEGGSPDMPELPALGPLSADTLDPFVNIVKNWLNECPPVNRLAFGASLGRLVADARTGYKDIQRYLPAVQLNPQDVSNFLYQINRPKESTVSSGTMINRLNSWTVMSIGTVGVAIEPTASKATANMQGQRHICRLDLDINTALLDDGVAKNDAYALFQELIKHGLEIASEGDVP